MSSKFKFQERTVFVWGFERGEATTLDDLISFFEEGFRVCNVRMRTRIKDQDEKEKEEQQENKDLNGNCREFRKEEVYHDYRLFLIYSKFFDPIQF